ncbi:hypothetical protein [Aestuariivivens sediminicola]|uniref:hypothetical protein n=1 Tax=Aestuariivivens sediminicola TaxID=2913560 RepID=UPI001F5659B2|nr:hypothetical protein [Aestuariivivens sediminicola]
MKENYRKLIKPGTSRKNLILGSLIATLVAITPYLFYLYESVPDSKVWKTLLFEYSANHYESAYVAMWFLAGKLIPLYILFLWFFTCKHWWYHTLLVPISMYAYQTFDVINKDAAFVDANQLIYLIPIMAIIIPSIYLIRARIFNKINEANKSMEELEEEFKISPKNFWDKISQYF